MKCVSMRCLVVLHLVVMIGVSVGASNDFDPWEPLVDDSWIYFGGPPDRLIMHTVNGRDFEVGFDQARGDNSARGMNALKFSFKGANTGHMIATEWDGSFDIQNTGDSRTFSDLAILVSIDADARPRGFSPSLGVQGEPPYHFDPKKDFGFYDHPEYDTGRPSGYYSVTSPPGEGLSHAFERGMVSVLGIENVTLRPGTSVTVDYEFENLPGTAVFSVYGRDSNVGWIYHTNRAVLDDNRPESPVSTFEVVSCGENAKLTARCKKQGTKVKAKLKKANPNRDVTFTLDGGREIQATTNAKGKAGAVWKGQSPGGHTVNVCHLETRCVP